MPQVRRRSLRFRQLLLLPLVAGLTACGSGPDLRAVACESAPLVKIGDAAAQCGLVDDTQAIVLPLRRGTIGAILLVPEDEPAGVWACPELGLRLVPWGEGAGAGDFLPQAAEAIESTQDATCTGD